MTIDPPLTRDPPTVREIHQRLVHGLPVTSRPAGPAPPASDRAAPSDRPSTGSPNRDARSSNVLAKTSRYVHEHQIGDALVVAAHPVRQYLAACPRPHAGTCPATRTTRHVPATPRGCRFTIATAEAVRGPPAGSNTGISPSTSPRAWMLSSCNPTRRWDSRVSFTRPFSSNPMRWSGIPLREDVLAPCQYTDSWERGAAAPPPVPERTCLNNAVCSNVFSSLGIAFRCRHCQSLLLPVYCAGSRSAQWYAGDDCPHSPCPIFVAPSAHPTRVHWSTVEKSRETGRHAQPPSPTV